MKILKRTVVILLAALLIASSALTAGARSFTHISEADGTTSNTYSREAYKVVTKLQASDFGLDYSFEGLSDVYRAQNGEIYLLSTEDSMITVLNSDYTLNRSVTVTDENGEKIEFKDARGVSVIDDNIYLCDTVNARILVLDMQGKLLRVWGAPQSSLIPEGFVYQPTRVEKDADGYFYVLSFGCYYGALTFSPEGEFIGFYGSNRVKATALDTLSYIWDVITSNDEKKSMQVKVLPYSFVDFCFDKEGYMVTCTGATTSGSNNGTGQLAKISPGGAVILFQRTKDGKFVTSNSVNFLERRAVIRFNKWRVQNLSAVDVDDNGYMYILDNTYGLVYVYDEECNIITAFGGGIGGGEQHGLFTSATSLALNGDHIMVSDGKSGSLTVFAPTDFGNLIKQAQSLYIAGDYDVAKPLFQQVLSSDRGNQLAYKGLAMAAYNEGDIKLALEYAKTGLDYNVYDLAYQQLFKNFVSDNFVWFFIAAILIIAGGIFLAIKLSRRKTPLIKNVKLKTALNTVAHPFRAFDDIKQKGQGSWIIAIVITLLFYIGKVLESTAAGFLYTNVSQRNYNTLITLAQTIGLVVLWSVTNWLVCTLFEGKGRFGEVYISTSYALIPMVLFSFIKVIASHFLPLSGIGFLEAVGVFILIYTFYLLSVAMMTVHEFTFTKFLLTSAVTVFGMLLVVFIGFMIIVLLQQFWNFIYAIYMEVAFR